MGGQYQRSGVLIHDSRDLGQRLKKVLDQWLANVEAYAQQWEEYASYYESERATVGLLASAVWQAGGQALTEVSQKKSCEGEGKNGWADLWLWMGDTEYYCEAKQRDIPLGDVNRYGSLVKGLLVEVDEAVDELVLDTGKDQKKVGLLFLNPTVSEGHDDINGLIEEFITHILRLQNQFSFCAFTFPGNRPVWEKKYYPGVCLLGKFY